MTQKHTHWLSKAPGSFWLVVCMSRFTSQGIGHCSRCNGTRLTLSRCRGRIGSKSRRGFGTIDTCTRQVCTIVALIPTPKTFKMTWFQRTLKGIRSTSLLKIKMGYKRWKLISVQASIKSATSWRRELTWTQELTCPILTLFWIVIRSSRRAGPKLNKICSASSGRLYRSRHRFWLLRLCKTKFAVLLSTFRRKVRVVCHAWKTVSIVTKRRSACSALRLLPLRIIGSVDVRKGSIWMEMGVVHVRAIA